MVCWEKALITKRLLKSWRGKTYRQILMKSRCGDINIRTFWIWGKWLASPRPLSVLKSGASGRTDTGAAGRVWWLARGLAVPTSHCIHSVSTIRWPTHCTNVEFIENTSHLRKFFKKSPQCHKGVVKCKWFIIEEHVSIQACLHNEKPWRSSQLLTSVCKIVTTTATDAARIVSHYVAGDVVFWNG